MAYKVENNIASDIIYIPPSYASQNEKTSTVASNVQLKLQKLWANLMLSISSLNVFLVYFAEMILFSL